VKKSFLFVAAAATAVAGFPQIASAAVISSQGFGYDRAGACQSAKNNASVRIARLGADVQSFGLCECSDNGSQTAQRWVCTVDAYYRPN
jgi:hypothetical protein